MPKKGLLVIITPGKEADVFFLVDEVSPQWSLIW